jgi:hypothetical protein
VRRASAAERRQRRRAALRSGEARTRDRTRPRVPTRTDLESRRVETPTSADHRIASPHFVLRSTEIGVAAARRSGDARWSATSMRPGAPLLASEASNGNAGVRRATNRVFGAGAARRRRRSHCSRRTRAVALHVGSKRTRAAALPVRSKRTRAAALRRRTVVRDVDAPRSAVARLRGEQRQRGRSPRDEPRLRRGGGVTTARRRRRCHCSRRTRAVALHVGSKRTRAAALPVRSKRTRAAALRRRTVVRDVDAPRSAVARLRGEQRQRGRPPRDEPRLRRGDGAATATKPLLS